MNSVLNSIVGNWQVNGILALRTGSVPYTLRSNGCQGVWNAFRPDAVAGKDPNAAPSNGRSPDLWLDTSCRSATRCLNRRQFRGCRPITLQLSATWTSRFSRTFLLEIGGSSSSGPRPSTLRTLRSTVLPATTVRTSTFGQVTSTASGSERHIQFALRIQF